jgi:hypothetical protein
VPLEYGLLRSLLRAHPNDKLVHAITAPTSFRGPAVDLKTNIIAHEETLPAGPLLAATATALPRQVSVLGPSKVLLP